MKENAGNEAKHKFPMRPVAPLGVIAMKGCEAMGDRVNEYLLHWSDTDATDEKLHSFYGTDASGFMLDVRCPRFGTGEGKGMLVNSVRGYDLYIICDVGAYQCTYEMYGREVPMTPDEHYADLKRIIAATAGKAYRINVIMPMLYEGRQHRRSARESLDCASMLQELVGLGVNNIITCDAHDARVANAIPGHGFDNLNPAYQALKSIKRDFPDFDFSNVAIIAPDEGALNRSMFYSSVLGVDLGMFYKRRDYSRIVDGRNPIIAHEFLGNDLKGKTAIVIDDMIASGDSMIDIAEL